MVPYLLVALSVLSSTPTTSRKVDINPPPPRVQVDMKEVQERTRQFEALRARHLAAEQRLGATSSLEVLGGARALCAQPPGFWARLLPGGANSEGTLNACRDAAGRTEQLAQTL